jgi:hypothetical protein
MLIAHTFVHVNYGNIILIQLEHRNHYITLFSKALAFPWKATDLTSDGKCAHINIRDSTNMIMFQTEINKIFYLFTAEVYVPYVWDLKL